MVAESSAESSSSGARTVTVWGVFQLVGVKSNSTAARVPSPGRSNVIGNPVHRNAPAAEHPYY